MESGGYPLFEGLGLLIAVTSLVAECGLQGAQTSIAAVCRLHGSQALEQGLQEWWLTGLVALRHVESSWTRDQTCVS